MKILQDLIIQGTQLIANSPSSSLEGPSDLAPENSETHLPLLDPKFPAWMKQTSPRHSPGVFFSPRKFQNLNSKEYCPDAQVHETLSKAQDWLLAIQDQKGEIRLPSYHLDNLTYLLPNAKPELQLKILEALDDLYSLHSQMHISSKKSFEKFAVPAIAALINQEQIDLAVRKESIDLLGRFAPRSKGAIEDLTLGLEDSDPALRAACLRALGKFLQSWDELLDPAVLKMLKDPVPSVRVEALKSLTSLEISSSQARTAILGSLQDPHPEVRIESLKALSALFSVYLAGDDFLDPSEVEMAVDLLDALYPLLHDGEKSVQLQTIETLKDYQVLLSFPSARISQMIRVHGQKQPEVGRPLHLRWARIQSLSVGIIEFLREGQGSNDADWSQACEALLGKIGAPYEADILKQIESLNSPQAQTVMEALNKLRSWQMFPSTAYDKVLALAYSPTSELKVQALATLGAIDPQRSLPTLSKFAENPDAEVRRAAIQALGEIPSGKDQILSLLTANKADPDAQVRAAALGALANYVYDPKILSILLEGYSDKSAAVRMAALKASRGWIENLSLEDFESNQLELHLVRLFSDPDAELRLASLEIFFLCYDLMPNAHRYEASILRLGKEDPDLEIRNLIEVYGEVFFKKPRLERGFSL